MCCFHRYYRNDFGSLRRPVASVGPFNTSVLQRIAPCISKPDDQTSNDKPADYHRGTRGKRFVLVITSKRWWTTLATPVWWAFLAFLASTRVVKWDRKSKRSHFTHRAQLKNELDGRDLPLIRWTKRTGLVSPCLSLRPQMRWLSEYIFAIPSLGSSLGRVSSGGWKPEPWKLTVASLRSLLASHGAGLRKQLSAGQFSPTLGPARSVK